MTGQPELDLFPDTPPPEYLISLSCGHTARTKARMSKGDWTSCWALMHPARGCQTQRKVTSVTEATR